MKDLDQKCFIYKITNKINNKIYIGQTISPNNRWGKHKYYGKNPQITKQFIHYAMSKYGHENFSFEILDTCLKKEADTIEDQYINKYDSRNPQFGYNIKPGGNSRGSWRQSEETKKRMSETWYSYRSAETFKKISNSNRGKKLSEESKIKLSKANKGKQNSLGVKHSKEVVQKRVAALKSKYIQKPCQATNCPRFYNFNLKKDTGTKYCTYHKQKLKRNGTLENQPNFFKGKHLSDLTKQKISASKKGTEPINKIKFTGEQVKLIKLDLRSLKAIGRDYNCGPRVIKRIKLS